jgi:hypothetical protein
VPAWLKKSQAAHGFFSGSKLWWVANRNQIVFGMKYCKDVLLVVIPCIRNELWIICSAKSSDSNQEMTNA